MSRNKNRVYFASPFFNEEQIEREERLKAKLRENGFEVWSPKENCLCPPNASREMRTQTFADNLKAIGECEIIFAVTDGKDVGTIWEAGYAYGVRTMLKLYDDVGHDRKIVYYCETLQGAPFNLMLAESGDIVVTNDDELEAALDMLKKGEGRWYAGEIE